MKGRAEKSELKRFIDIGIYCVAVIFLFFAVVLFMQEMIYIPEEVYDDPPPPPPSAVSSTSGMTTPVPTYAPYTPYYTFSPSISPTETAAVETTAVITSSEPYTTPQPTSTPTQPIFADGEIYPVKLYFINQKVSCEILPVRFNSNYQMDTIRSAHKAGWLYEPPYVVPGEVGKAIIAGHNRWGGKNGTFSVLKKMAVGEQVAVEMSDGYARYFRVDEISECPYNDNTIMEAVYDRPVLVLITCKGDWSDALHTSKTRVIVKCSPI